MADQELKYKISTDADTRGAEAAATGLKKVENASKGGAKAGGDLAKQNREGAEALSQLQTAASGGAGGLLRVGDALRNVAAVAKANPIGFLATSVVAALPAIKAGLDAIVNSYQRSIDRMREKDKAAGDALRSQLAGIVEANAAAMQRIRDDAGATAEAYGVLGRQIDEARKRAEALANARLERDLAKLDLEERTALSGAATPEQAANVSRTYARRREDLRANDAENRNAETVLNAQNRIAQADTAIRAATAPLSGLRVEAVTARSAADGAVERARQTSAELGPSSPGAKGEYEDARLAVARAEAAEKALAAAEQAAAALVEEAEAQRRSAELEIELAKIRKEKLEIERQSATTARGSEDAAIVNGLREKDRGLAAQATAAYNRGDFAGQQSAVAERGQVAQQIEAVAKAAESVKAPDTSATEAAVQRASQGLIQIGDQLILVVNGERRRVSTLEQAVEGLRARLENLASSSQ